MTSSVSAIKAARPECFVGRIRAITGIRAPAALIIATALISEIDVLVTNDRSWHVRSEAIAPGLTICLLADMAPV